MLTRSRGPRAVPAGDSGRNPPARRVGGTRATGGGDAGRVRGAGLLVSAPWGLQADAVPRWGRSHAEHASRGGSPGRCGRQVGDGRGWGRGGRGAAGWAGQASGRSVGPDRGAGRGGVAPEARPAGRGVRTLGTCRAGAGCRPSGLPGFGPGSSEHRLGWARASGGRLCV